MTSSSKKIPKIGGKNRIYLDYASLTPIDPAVLKEMTRYSSNHYANPSSLYMEGVAAREVLKSARSTVAQLIHARPEEIIFTSGGTEANNLAILGAVEVLHEQGIEYKDMHVLTSVIEHSSVRECFNYLNGKDVNIDVVGVDAHGQVSIDEIKKKIRPDTVIVSIMMVNNEIGTVQPIREIAKAIRQVREKHATTSSFNFQSEVAYPLFHTDAAQAFLFNEIAVEKLGVDLLSLDGSKVYGPRGVGALYKKSHVTLQPVLHGGGQEKGMRSGTEPLPLIAGLAKALEIAGAEREKEDVRVGKLRQSFELGLKALAKGIKINGFSSTGSVQLPVHRATHVTSTQSPHILNISIPRIDSEFFLLQLDAHGIACSTKSSCLRDEDESYVLRAIGANSRNSLRFSFGRWTTARDIDKTLRVIGALLGT